MHVVKTKHLNEQKLSELIEKVNTAVYGDAPCVVSGMPDDFALQESLFVLRRILKKI